MEDTGRAIQPLLAANLDAGEDLGLTTIRFHCAKPAENPRASRGLRCRNRIEKKREIGQAFRDMLDCVDPQVRVQHAESGGCEDGPAPIDQLRGDLFGELHVRHGDVKGAIGVEKAEICRAPAAGGIGGVHRGAERSFDISADLEELAHTSVAVVCAGAKSILDLGLTLEYLETHGVPLVGYRTDELPAFYTRSSGFKLEYRLDSPEAIAGVLRAKWGLGLEGGVVIANPVPERYAMPLEAINAAIETALADAKRAGITGKRTTPYLLDRVKELTGGESLEANIELALNNAALAAEVAVAFASG